MKARAIKDAITVLSEHIIDKKLVIETTCPDFDEWRALPNVVQYKGVELGKTGWNSDTGRACYKEGAAIAHSVK